MIEVEREDLTRLSMAITSAVGVLRSRDYMNAQIQLEPVTFSPLHQQLEDMQGRVARYLEKGDVDPSYDYVMNAYKDARDRAQTAETRIGMLVEMLTDVGYAAWSDMQAVRDFAQSELRGMGY